MSKFKNTMEIFLLLDKSNCRDCHLPTCLAFAAAVFKGQKQLNECPRLPRDIIKRFGVGTEHRNIESIFAMGTGLARMFKKIAFRHGFL